MPGVLGKALSRSGVEMTRMIVQKAITVIEVRLNARDCPACGVIYGLTDDFEQRKLQGGNWYCPNGHSIVFNESFETKLRQAEAENTRIRQNLLLTEQAASSAERREREAKKEIARIKHRASAGLCNHCNRHFANIERHVKSKHPAESPSHIDPRTP